MLDEEVNFELERKAPRSKALEITLNAAGLVVIVGGTVAGYISANHYLDFNKFFSVVIGGTTGFGISLGSFVAAETEIQSIRNSRFKSKQQRLDKIAEENGSQNAVFEYRGNIVDCIIRPEFERTGNIFYMTNNDGVINDPTFSYQPRRETNLKFRFDVPEFEKEKKVDSHKLLDIRLNATVAGINPNKAVQDHLKSLQIDKNSEQEYCKMLLKTLDGYKTKLHGSENLSVKFARCEKDRISTLLEYSGENFSSRLPLFSRCSSQLMNEAFRYRITKA